MEWVETTAKTVDDAKKAALDRLGVAADETEFEIVEEPRPGLFGRLRGEARVRARVKPAQVRPKNERRRKTSKDNAAAKGAGSMGASGSGQSAEGRASGRSNDRKRPDDAGAVDVDERDASGDQHTERDGPGDTDETTSSSNGGRNRSGRERDRTKDRSRDNTQEKTMHDDDEPAVSPQEVGDAAVSFMDGLTASFGVEATTDLVVDGTELDVAVTGDELGLLVGPGGRTLNAIQDLVRVSAQRRLGDHETRLRVDVAGYRVRRSEALSRFASDVAAQVRESGSPRSLEPMSSADRKVVHDALNEEEGVGSRSEGDDPNRRVVVVPE